MPKVENYTNEFTKERGKLIEQRFKTILQDKYSDMMDRYGARGVSKSIDQRIKIIFKHNGYAIEDGEESVQLQLDSLQFISIMCDIENEFDISIPDEVLSGENLGTYTDIFEMVSKLCEDKQGGVENNV